MTGDDRESAGSRPLGPAGAAPQEPVGPGPHDPAGMGPHGLKLRTGVGVDAHQLVQSRPMVMAGVSFPDEKVGPKGHSDGDVACHAVCDALLSAAGLGDLGQVFGTDDPAFAGASGVTLLAQVVLQVRQAGWQISNVAVQVIGNRPAMAPRRREAEELLSAVVGAPVSVSATSTDGMGFTGRSEGVMAVASALLMSW